MNWNAHHKYVLNDIFCAKLPLVLHEGVGNPFLVYQDHAESMHEVEQVVTCDAHFVEFAPVRNEIQAYKYKVTGHVKQQKGVPTLSLIIAYQLKAGMPCQ